MGNKQTKVHRFRTMFGSPSPSIHSGDDDSDYSDFAVGASKANNTFLSVRHLVRLVATEVIIYLVIYYAINLVYRFALSADQQREFERVVEYFDDNIGTFARDITFLLGFYVSLVARRWWDQYKLLPWPDTLAMNLTGKIYILYIHLCS